MVWEEWAAWVVWEAWCKRVSSKPSPSPTRKPPSLATISNPPVWNSVSPKNLGSSFEKNPLIFWSRCFAVAQSSAYDSRHEVWTIAVQKSSRTLNASTSRPCICGPILSPQIVILLEDVFLFCKIKIYFPFILFLTGDSLFLTVYAEEARSKFSFFFWRYHSCKCDVVISRWPQIT